ncbi:hypothetical protein LR48_Vigan01g189100 [Vigna angularis]|uniref:Transposase, Ptta/En/Spm, plant n=1 Tax=Phaseolus angularis TaxID=3914 RepID=A0A0L9TP56_PHAAN|nr:uncharacterized protein LOC108337150 isoform X2 [Vigna angularis]KOM32335.1 hypothetical protein LR48_Vigan01g189100 [Vigna angularis]
MNPQGDSSGTSPHLSIELLEKLLPSFLLAAENRQGNNELPLFPSANVPPRETFDVALGSNVPLSSSHAGTSQNPSSYIDLSLRLGPPNQGPVRSPAMNSCNIFAARHAVRMQGMHGQTNKRGFPDHALGDNHVGSMGQLALLAKRRATESHISASNYVNPSPPFSQMQQLFGKTTPVQVGQGGLKDKGKAIESSSSSSPYRQIGLPAQAYMQERLQYRPIGSPPLLHDLAHGPPPVAPGISMLPKLCPFLFEQRLDNENTKNAQNEKLDYADLQADMLLSDSESEEEEEETDEEDQEDDVLPAQDGNMTDDPLDDEGKYIIEPVGEGWSPAHRAIDGINYVIQSQFRGVFHSYGSIPLADRQEWFRMFKEKCTWDARHEQHIQKRFDSHCSKHLGDILSQVRNTRKKPQWMKVEDWIELLAYWDTPSFKNISARNKANRTSSKGRTDTGGYQDFTDVAKDLAKKFGREPYPDEFFLAANKYNYTGHWMDSCAPKTYEEYQLRLLKRQTQVGEASSSRVTQESRVDILNEVAKGKISGQVYGIADKAANLPTKATSLTQESGAPPSSSEASEEIDKAQQ